MKQLIAILAILLVALSPVVFAEENATAEDNQTQEAGKTLRERAQIAKNAAYDAREVAKEAVQDVREAVKEVKAARNETRGKIAEIGEGLKACKNSKTTDCDSKRKEGKVQAKDVLVKAAQDVAAMLETAKAKVQASEVADKEEITVKLDEQITKIGEEKAKAEALTENSTKKEIQTAAKDLRKAIQEGKRALKYAAHKMVQSKLGGVLTISEQLVTKLENRLQKLAEKGADVSSISLDAFKAKIAEAKTLYEEAATAFEKSKETVAEGEKDEFMKQATEKMQASHKALKEAREMLKELLQKMKELETKAPAKAAETNTSATPEVNATA
ncbi:MAG: hypothetical protein NTW67_00830 [Candidatus Woesearchaeota archaeon]|nr:hypothetical protein [Candidatus Woesearchaeota archaeon]